MTSQNHSIDYQDLSIKMQNLFRQVSVDIMRVYASDFTTQYKNDKTPVTQADIHAEHTIIEALKIITPDVPCVGEESYNKETHHMHKRFWLIDPIDGTRAFVAKKNVFTINAGLIENGKPVFGIVYNPLDDEMYIGSPLGAFRNDLAIKTRPVAKTGMIVALSSIPKPIDGTTHFLAQYTVDGYLELTSSIKICRIAEGLADIYPRLGTTCEWDTAAAHAVLYYAGGSLNALDGTPVTYGKDTIKNPHFVCKGTK